MLDLDEMRQTWAEQDRKLEESIRLNKQLLTAAHLNGARSALQRLTFSLSLGAVVWLAIVAAVGNFTYDHVTMVRLALPAVALDLFAIGMLSATVAQIAGVRRIDYGKPIATIQRRLESLRVLRIRTAQWGLLAGTVVWAPFLIVASKALLGVEGFSVPWLWTNLVFGLSLIPLAIWLSKKFGDRMGQFPFVQRLMNDIAGRNLNEATGFLATVSEFEHE
jgi:hypothetical protein